MPKFSIQYDIFAKWLKFLMFTSTRTHTATHIGHTCLAIYFEKRWCSLLFSIFTVAVAACCVCAGVSEIDSTRWRKISHIHTRVCFNLSRLFTRFLSVYVRIYDRIKSDNPKLFAFIYFHFLFVLWSHLSFIS